jgi:3-oxoadipate enol-lactonase/4-carboxymuconolactone decarboxylase
MTDRPLLHHRRDGGDSGATPLFLGPSIGTSLRIWEAAVPALAADRAVIRYDLPGHGRSATEALEDPSPGATTIAELGYAVLDLADHLGHERFHYAGVSLGGAVGGWLAIHHPERIASLTLVCSSARFGDPANWHQRAKLVRDEGTGPVADTAAGRWFTPAFAAGGAPIVSALLDDLRGASPIGYAACCDALAALDLRGELGSVTAPTLVVAGREDRVTPFADSRELADGIPGADLLEVAGAAHLANVERPRAVADALRSHVAAADAREADADVRTRETSNPDPRHSAGMSVRRAVLGDAHVDRAVANTTVFTADFQDFITRYAWGEIWTRPGLERRIRSAVTLTALVAHGHENELAMHLRAALTNGLSRDEIKEILLQTAVYCGVPAANSAFAVAQQVLAELDDAAPRGGESPN